LVCNVYKDYKKINLHLSYAEYLFFIFLLHSLPSFQIVGDDNLTPLGTIGPSMGFRVLDVDAYLVHARSRQLKVDSSMR